MKPCGSIALPRALILVFVLLLVSAGSQAQSGSTPYHWQNVKIVAGGFITGIVPHPTVPGVMFVRTDIGGAYRFNPSSKKWTPLTDIFNQNDWNLTGTESIALDPVDPSRVYLAQGTYTEVWSGKGAILRSNNFGASFTRTDLPIQLGSNEPGRYSGERLAVDPQHHNILYLGSRNNGLWTSTDFGATWSAVSSFPVTGPTSGVGVIFVVFQPTSQRPKRETIYVGVSDPTTGLYSSIDGGVTWQAVVGQPAGFFPTHQALAPDGNLYITYGDGTGADGMGGQRIGNGAVWKYNTTTGVWTNITPVGPWWTTAPYYGFGCSAHSYDGGFRRWANERDPVRYIEMIKQHGKAIVDETRLTKADRQAEAVFLGLRLMQGFSFKEYEQVFGANLREKHESDLRRFREAGLIECNGDLLRLTRAGALLSNEVFAAFV